MNTPEHTVTLTVNGIAHSITVPDRELLIETLRRRLGLTGSHIGCYNGDCGACTVTVQSRIIKACLMLTVSVDGADITTIEGIADGAELDPVQEAFWAEDAFQCGFCLPGHLFAARDLLATDPSPDDAEIRAAISGNLCRCTGYVNIVRAVRAAADRSA